jgi:hypothetical protein
MHRHQRSGSNRPLREVLQKNPPAGHDAVITKAIIWAGCILCAIEWIAALVIRRRNRQRQREPIARRTRRP